MELYKAVINPFSSLLWEESHWDKSGSSAASPNCFGTMSLSTSNSLSLPSNPAPSGTSPAVYHHSINLPSALETPGNSFCHSSASLETLLVWEQNHPRARWKLISSEGLNANGGGKIFPPALPEWLGSTGIHLLLQPAVEMRSHHCEHSQREFWGTIHSQPPLLGFGIQPSPPCAPQGRAQGARARFTSRTKTPVDVSKHSQGTHLAPFPALFSKIFLLIPLSTPLEHYYVQSWSLGQASRAFVGLGLGFFSSHLLS